MRPSSYFPNLLLSAAVGLMLGAGGATAGVARIGAFGLDVGGMDRSVRPGDDFFRYVDGAWYDRAAFAPDETYVGARASLITQRKTRVRALIEAAAASTSPSPAEWSVGALFASYMDTAAVERAGLKPLDGSLDRIRAIASREDLAKAFGRAPASGLASPFAGSVFYDFHAPGRVRYTLSPGGLGLPSPEAYAATGTAADTLRTDYRAYVADMLGRVGWSVPGAGADEVLALETRLAAAQWRTPEALDFLKTANDQSPAELKAEAPGFEWDAFLGAAGADGLGVVIVRQPSAMAGLARVVAQTPLPIWRAWLAFHLVSDDAPYLPAAIAARRFAFYGRLEGQEVPTPRWRDGVDLVEGALGQEVGRLYVARYFGERSKAMATSIFEDVRAVMRQRIQGAAWMSEGTRAEALRKMDRLVVKIGYPDKHGPPRDLGFTRADLYGNVTRLRRTAWVERLARARAPLDLELWQMTPQSSGAAANPNLDEITVPAGALEPPYFDPDADPAINYGAIGGVMGHELSHNFDELGRQMDATGALRDWWEPADAQRYKGISARVQAQFSAFEALPGRKVDGKLTLNEDIADISGLTLAHAAYLRSLGGRPALVVGGFTGEQRVFLGWAQMRRGRMRDAALERQLRSDPHAPDMFRVNGVVRNIDAWYHAFDVRIGDRLYLPPAERAVFW